MRKAGLGLAFVACAQLSLLSSPAFADDSSTKASLTPTESAPATTTLTATATVPASTTAPPPASEGDNGAQKKKTGWIILGIGGGVTLAGLIIDIAGTQVGRVSGTGNSGDSGTTSNKKTDFYFAGTSLLIAGIVTGVVGGAMVLGTDTTKSKPIDHTQEAREDGVTKVVQAAYQSAPTVMVPVLGATF
jgi:hypothetical protein